MRLALLLALIASAADAQSLGRVYNRNCDITSRRSDRGGVFCSTSEDGGVPFSFTIAPADGTGMGAACACAAITAADGTPSTFTRPTVQTCHKHSWWTGIMPGDAVLCPVDQPVIEPGGDGTGQLRYLNERALYNYATESENFNGVNWGKNNNTGVNCTVSGPDAGIDPFGNNRATRITCPATAAGEYVQVYNLDGTTGTPSSGGVYVRSYGAVAQTAHWSVASNVLAYPVDCAPGPFAAGWMRCVSEDVPNSLQSAVIGNFAADGSPAFDVLVFGAQFVVSDGITSYIPTNGAPAQRGASTLTFPAPVPQGADLTVSATVLLHKIGTLGSTVASLSNTAVNQFSNNLTSASDPTLTCHLDHATVVNDVVTTSTFVEDAVNTTSCNYNGDFWLRGVLNGVGVDAGTGANDPTDYDTLWVGSLVTGNGTETNGHIGPVTIASSAGKDIYLYGDGIVDGFPTYQCLPQDVIHAIKGNAVSVQNNGQTGDSIENCRAKMAATMTSIRASGPRRASRSYPLWQCGINGLDDGGTDPVAMAEEIKAALLDALDAGTHPVYATITAFPALPDIQARIIAINADMQAFCATNGIPYADTFTGTGGPGCDPLLRQCSDGGVHMQDAGCVAETVLWISAGHW